MKRGSFILANPDLKERLTCQTVSQEVHSFRAEHSLCDHHKPLYTAWWLCLNKCPICVYRMNQFNGI